MAYAILLLFALTGVVLFDHAHRLTRFNATVRGALAGVLGVLLLAATALYVWPALTDTSLDVMQADLAARKSEINTLAAEKALLSIEADRLIRDAAVATQREARDVAALAADVAQVRWVLTTGPKALVADEPISNGTTAHDSLRSDILSLATLRPAPVPQLSAAPPQPAHGLDALKGQMAARMTTPNYDIEAYPDRELVRGRAGRYYVVDLKNAASGVRFFFDGGKYTLARSSQEFRAALNSFVAEILAKFEGKVDYALFVRGSADQKPYEGTFEAGAEYRRIPFVRALGGDKYGVEMSERRVDGRVRNADLPDLRAAFLQKIVAETYPTKPPTILEGAVTPKTDNRDRNVELIMYVDW
jgi:hypothetical protein